MSDNEGDEYLRDIICTHCKRIAYLDRDNNRFLHTDDNTPCEGCTGYPRSNVIVVE